MRVLGVSEVAWAAEQLRAGSIGAMPTETVYGLAGAAFDAQALAQIFAAKERPTFDPLIIHVLELNEPGLIGPLTPAARATTERLIASHWPGPLTLVLPRGPRVPDLATSGLPTVAVRSPRHPVARALIAAVGPLAAPSANRFGRISPTCADDVIAELDGRIEWVLDGGPCAVGLESTIVAVGDDGALTLCRPGGIAVEAIGVVQHAGAGSVAAPGMLPSHYAPRKPMVFLEDLSATDMRVGLLAFTDSASERLAELGIVPIATERLGATPEAAARRLFAALRALDASSADLLVAEQPPTRHGLDFAIHDRLLRAAHGGASR